MDINGKQFQKALEATIIAEGFLSTANLIDQSIHDGFQRMSIYLYPHTVNVAVACELFLKVLLILQDGECPDKHTLVGLYERIDESVKEKVSKRYKSAKCKMSLGKCLQTYNNAVVEWRYLFDEKYEGKTLTAAWTDLIVLGSILCDIVEAQLRLSPFYEEKEQEEQTDAD